MIQIYIIIFAFDLLSTRSSIQLLNKIRLSVELKWFSLERLLCTPIIGVCAIKRPYLVVARSIY